MLLLFQDQSSVLAPFQVAHNHLKLWLQRIGYPLLASADTSTHMHTPTYIRTHRETVFKIRISYIKSLLPQKTKQVTTKTQNANLTDDYEEKSNFTKVLRSLSRKRHMGGCEQALEWQTEEGTTTGTDCVMSKS